jgi:hypothetical protein
MKSRNPFTYNGKTLTYNAQCKKYLDLNKTGRTMD